MSNPKNLFSKIKSEVKFAKAGEGQRLDEPSSSSSGFQTGQSIPRQNFESETAYSSSSLT
jgi:hypothetical protein